MTPNENIELFQKNILRLRRNPFTKQVIGARMAITWKTATSKTVRNVKRPGDHVISGYAALIRGFILNDDEWSLDQLPKVYYQLGASKFHMRRLKTIRQQIHGWLNRQSGLGLNGKPFTYGGILELYIYGNVIHFSRARELTELRKSWASYDLYMHFVCQTFQGLSRALNLVYSLNEMVLSKHSEHTVPLP
jgi:hypothetical protein